MVLDGNRSSGTGGAGASESKLCDLDPHISYLCRSLALNRTGLQKRDAFGREKECALFSAKDSNEYDVLITLFRSEATV